LTVTQVNPSAIFGAEKASGAHYSCGVIICRRFRSISEESPIVELEKVSGLLPTTPATLPCIIWPVSTIRGLLLGPFCGAAVAVPINAVTVTSENAIVK
jgi:hypothetical protein